MSDEYDAWLLVYSQAKTPMAVLVKDEGMGERGANRVRFTRDHVQNISAHADSRVS